MSITELYKVLEKLIEAGHGKEVLFIELANCGFEDIMYIKRESDSQDDFASSAFYIVPTNSLTKK